MIFREDVETWKRGDAHFVRSLRRELLQRLDECTQCMP